ncbi:hypothetical protein BCR41DRAFT_395293 [Lobosporangium transversale]|uniref:Uncharacterized protein n=1 Tax=Lobosporangium transversale TaxID=64571 RepID=A0A1Y2GSR9_9FUNG|nr:hypothetical protein BCR41DRAFT_395293 [Lobosporangium transversale]ORZ19152.1 hypothetical protein BCR41DRAFT_395293 [Lobosporangium transversale]|eukprot:XP_021882320.1 hypothetical protein BCR41DRAFT_395293 [Lobosporangium transversale]
MSTKPSGPQSTEVRDGTSLNADTVIRYSREFLLECAKSPLVQRPEALPPTSVWFGEASKDEPEANNSNGRKSTSKTTLPDRIILGPPKMSFASSSLGGLKRSEDGLSGFKKTLDSSRENRTPRGPSSALEQGFGRETIEKLASHKVPKVTPKDITGLLSGMDRRRPDPLRSNNTSLAGARTGTGSSSSRVSGLSRISGQPLSTSGNPLANVSGSTLGLGLGAKTHVQTQTQRSDAPEWMSYNPDSENASKEGESNSEPQVFVDDIQAWKARMKEHERREKEKEASVQSQRDSRQEIKGPSRADTSTSWRSNLASAQITTPTSSENIKSAEIKGLPALEKPLGRALLSNEPIQDIDMFFSPGALDLTKTFDSPSAFDKFLTQHTIAISSMEDPSQQKSTRKVDGSRFARFFTEDEPETQSVKELERSKLMSPPAPVSASHEIPGKQLSLDQLFQAHAPTSASTASPLPPSLRRMPSEAEILESLKANKSSIPVKSVENNEQSEDAFAFSKIMAALAKPPISSSEDTFGSSGSSKSAIPSAHYLPSNDIESAGITPTLHDPSIITFQTKPPALLETLRRPSSEISVLPVSSQGTSSSAPSEGSQMQGSGAGTLPPTTSSEPSRPTSRPIQVAFGGGIPTSVYRQLSGKTEGQKSGSPLIRPLSSVNGTNTNGGASPALSSPSVGSPRQVNTQAAASSQLQSQLPQAQAQPNMQQQHSQPQSSQPQPQPQPQPQQQQQTPQSQQLPKNFVSSPFNQGSGPVHHSPVLDPRMGGMYGNGAPSPMVGPGHALENESPNFYNGMPMQRPGQGMPPQFAQQIPPFNQQLHVSGPGDYMSPHPSQYVGMPPFVGGPPMHPGMFPMNPVEMLIRGPTGPPPPRPIPGMGPGPGPSHFVPNNFGHPMGNIPHPGMAGVPMNPSFYPPQVSKPMMNREEFDRRHRQ